MVQPAISHKQPKNWTHSSLLFSYFRTFLREENGQGTVEYILLLSAIVVVSTQAARQLLKAFDNGVLWLGGALEKDLRTGKAGIGIWKDSS